MPLNLPNVAHLSCAVSLAAAPAEKAGPPTINVDPAYTGGAVRLNGWPLPLVIDLATLSNSKRQLINLDHVSKQRVGHITATKNDGKSLSLVGLLSWPGADADTVLAAKANDYPLGGSIEVKFDRKLPTLLAAGKTATLNGRTFTGPLLLGRYGELFGLAITDNPADGNTAITVAASADRQITLGELKVLANLS